MGSKSRNGIAVTGYAAHKAEAGFIVQPEAGASQAYESAFFMLSLVRGLLRKSSTIL